MPRSSTHSVPHGALPSMHSFRHTVASRALLACESVDEVAFLLGHRDANVTRAVDVRELSDARRRTMRRSRMIAEYSDLLASSVTADGRRDPEYEFFIDRSLGRRHLPEALRSFGLVVHTMASVYGEEVAQRLADDRWLRDAGAKGWIVLMKDDAIRRRPAERDALVEAGVRAFCSPMRSSARPIRPSDSSGTATGSSSRRASRAPTSTASTRRGSGACGHRIGLVSSKMSSPKHDIKDHEVCILRAQVGDWPAGTEGTAVSIYEDAALLELSGRPMEEALDNLIVVPANKLELIWRMDDPLRRNMEA